MRDDRTPVTGRSPDPDDDSGAPRGDAERASMVRDEVCGMRFPAEDAVASAEYGGRTYFFCAERCRRRFLEHPTWYVPAAPGE